MNQQKLVKAIMAIQNDPNLTDEEKAKRRQDLLSGKWSESDAPSKKQEKGASEAGGKRETRSAC
jgi:hypothetical protein